VVGFFVGYARMQNYSVSIRVRSVDLTGLRVCGVAARLSVRGGCCGVVQGGVEGVTHGWSVKVKLIDGWIECGIGHGVVAGMMFLNGGCGKREGGKLSCVAFY